MTGLYFLETCPCLVGSQNLGPQRKAFSGNIVALHEGACKFAFSRMKCEAIPAREDVNGRSYANTDVTSRGVMTSSVFVENGQTARSFHMHREANSSRAVDCTLIMSASPFQHRRRHGVERGLWCGDIDVPQTGS